MRRNSLKLPKKKKKIYRNHTTKSQPNINKEWIALRLLKPLILIIIADELVPKMMEVIPIRLYFKLRQYNPSWPSAMVKYPQNIIFPYCSRV